MVKAVSGTSWDSPPSMVEQQIEARGITNLTVLKGMRSVPRQVFVSNKYTVEAYENRPLPIGFGQTIPQPCIAGYMTEISDPKPDDRVLEIGTGSGYQGAVLSLLVREVYTVENVRELADQAGDCFVAWVTKTSPSAMLPWFTR